MTEGNVRFELLDDAPLDCGVWKEWKNLVLDMEWPTDDSSVTTLGPIISTTHSVFAVDSENNSLIGAVLWNEIPEHKLAWIGCFAVPKEYRGQGIGIQVWNRAMQRIPDDFTKALKSVRKMHDKYVSGGFSLVGPAHTRYEKCSPDKLLEVCREKITMDQSEFRICKVESLDEDEWKKVKEFDREVSGRDRSEWLEKYRGFKDAYSIAVFCQNNAVVCYASIVVTCHLNLHRYKLAPVYATDEQYALLAIQNLAEWLKKEDQSNPEIIIYTIEGTSGQRILDPIFKEHSFAINAVSPTIYTQPFKSPADTSKIFIPYNNPCCFDT